MPEEFALVTVTPEMLKLPPASIEKILKLPLLPSMIRLDAPRPLMLRVPAVPAPTTVFALTIAGSAELRVMV